MNPVFFIAKYTGLQQFRNRLYLIVALFGAVLAASSLLFGALAADEELRVILNAGLSAIELFGLIAACFGAVTLVLEEVESRTVYLILARPFPRRYYVLGRFLGLFLAVAATMLVMSLLLIGLLHLKGWQPDFKALCAIPFMLMKVMTVAALAVFFSLFSSSSVFSITFTFFFWIIGHFGKELEFMARKSQNALIAYCVQFISFVVPDLSLLNGKDFFHSPHFLPSQMGWAMSYACLYSAACLALSILLFQKKEM